MVFKYRIAKVVDDSDYEEYPYLVAIDPIGAIKTKLWKIRGIIFNQINKINHPCICGIINRHKMPEPTGPYGLDVFGPRKCLRCGEVRSANLIINNVEVWKGLNKEAEMFLSILHLNHAWEFKKEPSDTLNISVP